MPAGRTVTTCILFQQLAAAGELLQHAAGDERARVVVHAHQRLARAALQRHNGREVKWLENGLGLMAAFRSAREAVDCAVAMRQAARRPAAGARLQLRTGIHAGETLTDGDDFFGAVVVIARRLCDLAAPGQIVVSRIVRDLAATGAATTGAATTGAADAFRDLGALTLKGIDAPVDACEIAYAHDPAALLSRTPFVGRAAQLAALDARLRAATRGDGAVVTLAGEPGIGKTRLAEELSERARIAGARVLWGRCYEGDWSAPFQPFAEALAAWAAEDPPDSVAAALRDEARVLPRVVPALAAGNAADTSPDPDRPQVLAAFAAVFRRIAAATPLVLVVDDLHWADAATLAVLRALARETRAASLLILCTYRDVEVGPDHPVAAALADVRRDADLLALPVRGLPAQEVAELIEIVTESGLPPALTRAIGEESAGNPFFIRELLLHLAEEGRLAGDAPAAALAVPAGVRDVINRRLARLSPAARDLLTTASAMAGGVAWPALQAIAEDAPPAGAAALLDALEETLAAQLLVESAPAAYDFQHALIRHTLYEALSTPRRILLHRRIAGALERHYASAPDAHLHELAHHFVAAAPGGDHEKAAGYAVRAGEQSLRVAAYEDAAFWWRTAEALYAQHAHPLRRAHLLERLGDLMFMSGLDWQQGVADLEQALAIYEQDGDEARAAQIHSRLGRSLSSFSRRRDIPRALAHYRAAAAVLQRAPDSAAAGYAQVGLANAALFAASTPEGLDASATAIALAERTGHEVLWANAATLHGFHLVNGGRPSEGLDFIQRAYHAADRHNHALTAFLSAWHHGHVLAHLAMDPAAAEVALRRELALPRIAQAPLQRNMLKGVLVDAWLIAGRLEDARTLDAEAGADGQPFLTAAAWDGHDEDAATSLAWWLAEGERAGNRWHVWMYACALADVRLLQRRPADARELLLRALDVATTGGHVAAELQVRSRLARIAAAEAHIDDAAAHVARCEAIVAAGDGWRGSAGLAPLARASLAAACHQDDVAGAACDAAAAVFRRYGLQHHLDDVRALQAGISRRA